MTRSRASPFHPGFTISTRACNLYFENRPQASRPDLKKQVGTVAMRRLEREPAERSFGDPEADPLLVSVRSGAKFSMPGMMDTILNLGLNDQQPSRDWPARAAIGRSAFDSYRRFIQMYARRRARRWASTPFDDLLNRLKKRPASRDDRTPTSSAEGPGTARGQEVQEDVIKRGSGQALSTEPRAASSGVRSDRRVSELGESARPALSGSQLRNLGRPGDGRVNVQCHGLRQPGRRLRHRRLPSRGIPSTGENKSCTASILQNAQGEDVVAGIRTPKPISGNRPKGDGDESLAGERCPSLRAASGRIRKQAGAVHYKDMQDVEFTVERGQALHAADAYRQAHRPGGAEHRVRPAREGPRDLEQGGRRADRAGDARIQLLAPDLRHRRSWKRPQRPRAGGRPRTGLRGRVRHRVHRLHRRDAEDWRPAASGAPGAHRDQPGGHRRHARRRSGILTSRGGMTSHAAVVARGMGKPCVVGAEALRVDEDRIVGSASQVGGRVLKRGRRQLSIDGATGE